VNTRTSPGAPILNIEGRAAADGTHQYRVIGEVLPVTPGSSRFTGVIPAIPGVDRAHLWGRNFGSEAAAGIMYAPKDFNRSVQRYMENRIGDAQEAAAKAGNRLILEATATSKPVADHGGKEYLDSVRYRAAEVDGQGRIVATHFDVEFGVRANGSAEVRSPMLQDQVIRPGRPR
jgi:hypothetical protein